MEINELHQLFLAHPKVTTDTRKVVKGGLFFALKGENFNGNEFAAEALKSGAAYAVIDEVQHKTSEKTIVVNDVLNTLQELARYHRRTFEIPVIGITGSNGKTTTKELMRDALSTTYKVLATKGNLNNHIGVPLTLLELDSGHDIAIIEMGANHVNEIELLSSLCAPTHGLITNIGRAHIGEFGGRENIIKGKCELYDNLRASDGLVFVNGDDALLSEKVTGIDHVSYGYASLLDFQGRVTSSDPYLTMEFRPNDEELKTQLVGEYNFGNVMSAACVADHFQVPLPKIIKAIEEYEPENNRSQMIERDGKKIIMDAYNANPDSMLAAIENFAAMEGEGKVAILGDMKELGAESSSSHKEVADKILQLDMEAIFVGEEFSRSLAGTSHQTFLDTATAKDAVREAGANGSFFLIKGSRGVRLEAVLEVF